MNDNYTREIDLIDLFIDWLGHWRSLIVFLLAGVIAAGGYMYVGRGSETPAAAVATEEATALTDNEIQVVEDVASLNEEYTKNVELYNSNKESMEVKDRAEAFYYITQTKNIIDSKKAALSEQQLNYYYGVDGDEETKDEEPVAAASSAPSKTKAALIAVLAVILHFIIFACRYIFDNRIKHTDTLSAMTGVPEYTRMVDWSKVDSSKGLDKLVNSMRFAGTRKTALSEVVEINSSATIEKLKNKNYESVAVVGTSLDTERGLLVSQLIKDAPATTVKSIDSITHSVNGADDIAGVDAAILAVRVGGTRYNDFLEELQSLRDRDVDVLGIAVFE